MKTLAKAIRIITVAPIFAAIMLTIIYLDSPSSYKSFSNYIVLLIALVVFPLLAYPISLVKVKEQRRNFQRSLAIIFSLLGYITGTLYSFLTKSPKIEKVISLTYLISGIMIALMSFLINFKSSGHACGVCGPISILVYAVDYRFAFMYIIMILVFWSSLKIKRHTLSQLIVGSIIPIISLLTSVLIL